MMRPMVSLFILLIAYLPGQAQQFGELPDENMVELTEGNSTNKVRSGIWKGFYANDVPAYLGSYTNGERSGSWTYYHRRGGKIHSTGWYANGMRDSSWTFFYEDEKPWAKGNYDGDLMQGEWQFIYPNGTRMAIVHFVNGDGTKLGKTGMPSDGRQGPLIAFQEDGDTLDIQNWSQGKINGPYRSFHANGKTWKTGMYKNGQQDGQWIEYHENGNHIDVAEYTDGKITGEHQQYDPASGKSILDRHRENGLVAYEREYEPAGVLRSETLYERERSRAVERSWYVGTDQLKKETWYTLKDQRSESLSYRDSLSRSWWSNGQLRSEEPHFEGRRNGLCIQFHENGHMYEQATYVNGDEHGPFKRWYPNEQLLEEGTMNQRDREGVWTQYYDNGQLQQEAGYVKGNEQGPYKSWYLSGQIEAEGNMNLGERDGSWRTYFLDGSLAEEGSYQSGRKVGRWRENINNASDLGTGAYRICNYNDRSVEIGELIMYDAKGTKRLQGTWGDQLLAIGQWTQWHSNGAIRSVVDHGTPGAAEPPCGYRNGKVIELRDSLGNVLFNGGSGEVIDRMDGVVLSTQFYRNGCRDSTWVVYLDRFLVSTVDVYEMGNTISSYSLRSADREMNDPPSQAKKIFIERQRERFNGLAWQERGKGMRMAMDQREGSGPLKPSDLVEYEYFMTTSLAEPMGMAFKDGSPYQKELIEGDQLLSKDEFNGITSQDLAYGQWTVIEYRKEVVPRSFLEWMHEPCSAYYLVFRLNKP